MSSSPTKDVVTASTATTTSAAATGCNLLKIKVRNAIKKSHHGSKYDIESSKFQAAACFLSLTAHSDEMVIITEDDKAGDMANDVAIHIRPI
ncbi:hypothetical protein OsJ_21324 [Oryza sativa Japonica Group]|uniref:Uncharacterized protein n=1 Tax=Oryza sativa subsp. japonica TaxID=39947 RepID=A3BBP5_ORYSJ|nr:hypothetical protein OsJ_21324 [Oryza sativa Japonica Group]